MAKGKVHKAIEVGEGGTPGFGNVVALCRQKHRPILPLLIVDDWRVVTCAKCLRHRPARSAWAVIGAPVAAAYGWVRAAFRGRP